jgi:hypothetical protein
MGKILEGEKPSDLQVGQLMRQARQLIHEFRLLKKAPQSAQDR